MNYSVATVILLMVLGAIVLMEQPTSEKSASGRANGEKWYTTRTIVQKARYGSDDVIPQGAEVEFIDEKTVRFRAVTFVVAPGDLVSASEKAQEAARRKSMEEELASMDREIKELEEALERSYRVAPPRMKSQARMQQEQRQVLSEELQMLVDRRQNLAQQLR